MVWRVTCMSIVIYNPISGNGAAKKLVKCMVIPVLTLAKVRFTVIETQYKRHAIEIAATLDVNATQGIIIAGVRVQCCPVSPAVFSFFLVLFLTLSSIHMLFAYSLFLVSHFFLLSLFCTKPHICSGRRARARGHHRLLCTPRPGGHTEDPCRHHALWICKCHGRRHPHSSIAHSCLSRRQGCACRFEWHVQMCLVVTPPCCCSGQGLHTAGRCPQNRKAD